MNTTTISRRQFEFCYPQIDTLILVEETDDEVVIRATRNTFTEEQKVAFIRGLASEGFIADCFRWCPSIGGRVENRVRWLVDYSWLKLSDEVLGCSRRFMSRLFVSAALLWVLLMWALWLRFFR